MFSLRHAPHYLLLGGCLLASIFLWAAHLLYADWRSGHVVLYQPAPQLDLLTMSLTGAAEKVSLPLITDKRPGLPIRSFFISEKSVQSLMAELPANIKKWQPAFIATGSDKLQKVKIRTRGDNPINWAYTKKSWRVKTRKSQMIGGARELNYVIPRTMDGVQLHLSYVLARKVGLLAPKSRLVELFINGNSEGPYLELPSLNESFLRRSSVMPVNLYKGEQENKERRLGIGTNLFNNPELWKKAAVFNQLPETDKTDLERFLRLMREAETSASAFRDLKKVADIDTWARFASYQVLVQSWHNNYYHNQRLVSDPWRGVILPLPHDVGVGWLAPTDAFGIDHYSTPLLDLYGRSSEFILKKYLALSGFLNDGIIDQIKTEISALTEPMHATVGRDTSRYTTAALFGASFQAAKPSNISHQHAMLISSLDRLKTYLTTELQAEPSFEWSSSGQGLALSVSGRLPISDIGWAVDDGAVPEQIYWDRDANGKVTDSDLSLPFRQKGGMIKLDAVFLANRVPQIDPGAISIELGRHQAVATRFHLIADRPLSPISISAANALTGERTTKAAGVSTPNVSPSALNLPIALRAKEKIPVFLSGEISVTQDMEFDLPVTVSPGTVFRMAHGTSLIFRGPVRMDGTATAPIRIVPAQPDTVWGTVAIAGRKAEGSVLRHVEAEGGSGKTNGRQRFISMFSIHDTRNISLDHVTLRRNSVYDDMLHVIYANGVSVTNSHFENAMSDAVDVDMSSIRFSNVTFRASGNDGLDFMSSNAIVESARFLGSGDKGISIGEASTVFVMNSEFKENAIGLEAKDGSRAALVDSRLISNRRHLNAYKKNWRYGGGGRIVADRLMMGPSDDGITADKHSDINILTRHPHAVVESGAPLERRNDRYPADILSILEELEVLVSGPTIR